MKTRCALAASVLGAFAADARALPPPLAAEATAHEAKASAVRVSRAGQFFTAKEGASRYEVLIPVPAGTAYRRATITFAVHAPSFPGPALHSIVGLTDPGVKRPQGRYFALQHTVLRAAEKGVRTNIDNLVGGTSVSRTDVLDPVRAGQGASLRYTLVYDTLNHCLEVEIADAVTGHKNAFRVDRTNAGASLIEENEINAVGPHLVLSLGLDRVYDHGGYYPPYGWSFSDLRVELEEPATGNAENVKR